MPATKPIPDQSSSHSCTSRTVPTQVQRSCRIDASCLGDHCDPSPSPAGWSSGSSGPIGSPTCGRLLLCELGTPGLEDLSHLVREDAPSDPPLHGAAEPGDLVGEDVTRIHDESPPLDRQKTRHRLLPVIPRADVVMALDDRAGRPVGCGEHVHQDIGRLAFDVVTHPAASLAAYPQRSPAGSQ
jgi:hypothetical protein